MHSNERPQYIVKDGGLSMRDIKDWDAELKSLTSQLTEEEKRSPYAKYYYRDIFMPSQENLAAGEVHNPLPKELALRPEELIAALDSDKINDLRSGYYVFEDGVSFSLSRLEWPGVTDEKLEYFNKNYDPDHDLFYKTWYPGMHLRHYKEGCVEDVGLGMELIQFIGGLSLDELTGEKDKKINDPRFAYFNSGAGVSWPMHNIFNHARYAFQANYVIDREDIGGREIFMAFWQGITLKDQKIVRALPEGESINIENARAHMNHSIWEYVQMGHLINMFWDDEH